jgi:hypothetical protein
MRSLMSYDLIISMIAYSISESASIILLLASSQSCSLNSADFFFNKILLMTNVFTLASLIILFFFWIDLPDDPMIPFPSISNSLITLCWDLVSSLYSLILIYFFEDFGIKKSFKALSECCYEGT